MPGLRPNPCEAARRELVDLVGRPRTRFFPLVVQPTLVRHYVRQFAVANLQAQTYLEPHPKELILRNHV